MSNSDQVTSTNPSTPVEAIKPIKMIDYDEIHQAFEEYKKDHPPKEPDSDWDEHVKRVVTMLDKCGERVPGAWSDALRNAGL